MQKYKDFIYLINFKKNQFVKYFERLFLRKFLNGTPDMIRTCDRWYRKPVLYPAELRAHTI